MADQRTEFEIALKDSASAELKLIASYMREIVSVARSMGEVSGTGMEKFGKGVSGATEEVKKARSELNVVGSFFTGFAKGILAPLGSVYALEQFGRAIYNVSVQRIQLELFANTVGFTTKQISVMTQVLANMGIEGGPARQAIGGIGTALREAEALGVGSKLITTLNTMGRGEWASELLKVIQSGDFGRATKMLQEEFPKWTKAHQFYFVSQTGINQALLADWKKYSEGVRAEYEVNLQNTELFVRRTNQALSLIGNVFRGVIDQVLGQLMRLHSNADWNKLMESAERGARKALDAGHPQKDIGSAPILPADRFGFPKSQEPRATPPRDKYPWEGAIKGIFDYFRELPNRPAQGFGGAGGGRAPLVGIPGLSILGAFGSGGKGPDDLIKIEEDSNRILKEIRDFLDPNRQEGGGRGTIFRPGVRQAYGGGAGGGRGGAGGGGYGGAPEGAPSDYSGTVTPGPGEGSSFLAEKRAGFTEQMKDPAVRELVGGILSAENPGAGPAVVESLLNRTEMVNARRAQQGLPPLTLRDMIMGHPSIDGGRSFYGPVRSGALASHIARLRRDPTYRARINSSIDQALGGSNVVRSFTDQGSAGDPNYGAPGGRVDIHGERFNTWQYPGAAEWQRRREQEYNSRQEQGRSGATGGARAPISMYFPGSGQRSDTLADRSTVDKASRPGGSIWDNARAAVRMDFVGMPKGVRAEGKVEGVFKDLEMYTTPDRAKPGSGSQDHNTYSYE